MKKNSEVDSGIAIVGEILDSLSKALGRPEIAEFICDQVGGDWDHHRYSITLKVGGRQTVIAKVPVNDLKDCATTPEVKEQLEKLIRAAVFRHFTQDSSTTH